MAVVAAAKAAPVVKVKKEGVITLPALATGTWRDHIETGHLVGDDASGRAYAQFRVVLPGIMSPLQRRIVPSYSTAEL